MSKRTDSQQALASLARALTDPGMLIMPASEFSVAYQGILDAIKIVKAQIEHEKTNQSRACRGTCGCDASLICQCLCHEQYPSPVKATS